MRVGEVEDGHGRRLVLGVHRHGEATPKDIHRALAVNALALKALMQRGNLGLSGLRLRLQVLDQLLELCDVLCGGHRNEVPQSDQAWRDAKSDLPDILMNSARLGALFRRESTKSRHITEGQTLPPFCLRSEIY